MTLENGFVKLADGIMQSIFFGWNIRDGRVGWLEYGRSSPRSRTVGWPFNGREFLLATG